MGSQDVRCCYAQCAGGWTVERQLGMTVTMVRQRSGYFETHYLFDLWFSWPSADFTSGPMASAFHAGYCPLQPGFHCPSSGTLSIGVLNILGPTDDFGKTCYIYHRHVDKVACFMLNESYRSAFNKPICFTCYTSSSVPLCPLMFFHRVCFTLRGAATDVAYITLLR